MNACYINCYLHNFNFDHIYIHPKLKGESNKIKRCYRILFEILLEDLSKKQEQSYIWKDFLHNKSERYLAQTSDVQKVVDYIAGMTDNFFIRTLNVLIVPGRITI